MIKPTLALIPAAYKIGKLYSILPTSGDGDFTVARNSVANRVNSNGLLEEIAIDVPRLDYSDGTCPSLLTEPQSTNLVTYSNDFTNAVWTKTNTTITDNAIISPDGALNADKLVEDTATSLHNIQFVTALVSGTTYTFSLYAKKGERNWLKLDSSSNGNWSAGAFFDLENGVVGSIDDGTAKIENYGDGWYKCSITGLCSASVSVGFLAILSTDGATTNYLGDGTSGVYTYQAQVEALSYATSPIFTSGATATRIADVVNGCGTVNDFNSSEGVLFFEGSSFEETPTAQGWIYIGDGTVSNFVAIVYNNATNALLAYSLIGGAASIFIQTTSFALTNTLKIAFKWKENDAALWVNGTEIGVDTSTLAYTANLFNTLALDRAGSLPFYGKTKQLQVYKTALTDAELIQLTT